MEVKVLDNIPEIFLIFMKIPFHTPKPFVIIIKAFKLKNFFLIIADIKSAFRYI